MKPLRWTALLSGILLLASCGKSRDRETTDGTSPPEQRSAVPSPGSEVASRYKEKSEPAQNPQTARNDGHASPHEIALTSGKAINESPRLSSDGMNIVFVRNSNVWTMNEAGGNLKQLTHFNVVTSIPRGAQHPSWSPDGRRIAFRGIPSAEHGGIFLINGDGTNLIQLTTNWLDDEPDWSPDGDHIVFTSRPRLWVMDSDSKNAHPLTFGDLRQGIEFSPRWSPKGDRIAYLDSSEDRNVPKIHVIDPNGENQQSLGVNSYDLAWSRDGKFLYFQYGTTLKKLNAQDWGDTRTILDWEKGYENRFDVSPDGLWMVSDVTSEDGVPRGGAQIYRLLLP